MNLDELMAVWRTQDAAPLHDVNKTLLHLALRHDEAKQQKERRTEKWIVYLVSAGLVAVMSESRVATPSSSKSRTRLG